MAPILGSARWPRNAGRLIITAPTEIMAAKVADPQEASSPPSGSASPTVSEPNHTAATTTIAVPTALVTTGAQVGRKRRGMSR